MKNKKQSPVKLLISIAISVFILVSIVYFVSKNKQKTSVKLTISDINDSLNINGLTRSGRWIDTEKTNIAFSLYKGDTCILRMFFIDQKQKLDIPVFVVNLDNGPVKITPIDTFDLNGEYFVVNQGILEMYNKNNEIHSKAVRLSNK